MNNLINSMTMHRSSELDHYSVYQDFKAVEKDYNNNASVPLEQHNT